MTSKYKIGDTIELKTKDASYAGLVMPSTTAETLFLRLFSGYQVGIKKKEIKSATIVAAAKKEKETVEKKKVEINPKLSTISILHTGGTIASKVDYKTGAVIARFTPEEILAMFPELQQIANIKSRLVRNMWSENMRFAHYNVLAEEIKKEIAAGVDGIIITHGTDTLHYTAAALSFILENLPVPVLLVGSQRSSDRGSTDAHLNLMNAVYFAANTDLATVAICMHNSTNDDSCVILPGTKTRKMHTSRRDAFKAINASPIALVDYHKNEINYILKHAQKKDKTKKLELKLFNEKIKVGIIYQHTNMFAEQFKLYEKYDGLILLSTGLGCPPIIANDEFTAENAKIFKALQSLMKKGIIIAFAPQTIYGRIVLTVYEPQRMVLNAGVLGNCCDMTPETSFIKLAWLLSNYNKEDVKKLYSQNLRGELADRITMDMDEE